MPKVKIRISTTEGLVQESDESGGFDIFGKDYHNAVFDDLWDDEKAEIAEGTGPAALTYEAYQDTGFFMHFFRHNQDDSIFTKYQMSHQWDPTTSVYPHIHFVPMASGTGNIRFSYAYTWSQPFGLFSSSIGWISGTLDVPVSASQQYLQLVANFGEVLPLSGARESDVLIFKVERSGNDAADTYTASKDHGTAAANVGILFFDTHYRKIKAGTDVQFPGSSI